VSAGFAKLRNLLTDTVVEGRPAPPPAGGRQQADEPRVTFDLHLMPHSYAVFAVEK
jgi:hypothetical protein